LTWRGDGAVAKRGGGHREVEDDAGDGRRGAVLAEADAVDPRAAELESAEGLQVEAEAGELKDEAVGAAESEGIECGGLGGVCDDLDAEAVVGGGGLDFLDGGPLRRLGGRSQEGGCEEGERDGDDAK